MYVWCDQGQCYQFRERDLPFGVPSYVGSQWFVYSREFAQYLYLLLLLLIKLFAFLFYLPVCTHM